MENELAAAYSSQNPQTDQMAAQGRKGDAMMAHVTPGDYVIPKDILVQHPDFLVKLKKVMADEHEDYRTHMVGSGFENINPETGAAEFGFGRSFRNAISRPLNAVGNVVGEAIRGVPVLNQASNAMAKGISQVSDPLGGKNIIGSGSFFGGLSSGITGKPGAYDESKNGMGAAGSYSPSEMKLPGSLQELGGLTNIQRRSYLAAQGAQGEGLGGNARDYYTNLLQRNIQSGEDANLLPVESQFLNQGGVNTNLSGQALIDALRGF